MLEKMQSRAHYHLVGVGGIGMSALAEWLLKEGVNVSGSDIAFSPLIARLESLGATITIGHSKEAVKRGSHVVFSSDIRSGNVELEAAREFGCKTFHRSDLIRELVGTSPLLVVTGAHGKTSTSALLSEVLDGAGLSPSFLLGGISRHFGVNGKRGEGRWVVLEGDESDGSFLNCLPEGAIVTNFDREHLSYWKTEEALLEGFLQFQNNVQNERLLFFCGDDKKLSDHFTKGIRYGFGKENDLRLSHVRQIGWDLHFDIEFEGKHYKEVLFRHIGDHQALNAAAVFGLCLRLGVDEHTIREVFKKFGGVKRRLEVKGEVGEILYLDDYGHHPTEILTTLKGVKKAFPLRRLVVAFQPHRYTRTADCLSLFGEVFDDADLLLMTEIYSAGETPLPGIDAELIKNRIEKCSTIPIEMVSRDKLGKRVEEVLKPFDICLSLGAGDITKLFSEITPPIKKLEVGVLFGGASVEYEISLRSAAHVIEGCSFSPFTPRLFGVDRQGGWHIGEEAKALLRGESVPFRPLSDESLEHLFDADIIFPVMHGTNGEDGRLQGMLEILSLPYVGCNSASCQLAMDKDLTKLLVKRHGVPVAPYTIFTRTKRGEKGPYPLWVKPVHLGSSIGVKRVTTDVELEEALKEALLFDDKVIVEAEVKGREIEFLVVGNDEVMAFPPGEVLSNGAFYSYEAKYAAGGFDVDAAVALPEKLLEKGKKLASLAYEAIGGKGFARIDFFLDANGEFWLNELNPIPGFTSISLVPKIAHINGYPIEAFTRLLILLGLQEGRRRKRLKVSP